MYGRLRNLTKPKYQEPRSRVRQAKKDSPSVETTIPEKIAHAMRLQPGDSIEWVWITQGLESYCRVSKIPSS
jgi:uncharacterized cupredoxin-like copper-binding protein